MIGVFFAGLGGALVGAAISGLIAVVGRGLGLPPGPGWLAVVIPMMAFCAWGAIQNRNR